MNTAIPSRPLLIAALLGLAAGPLVAPAARSAAAPAGAVEQLLEQYRAAGAGEFSAERGATAWRREVAADDGGEPRHCGGCHGADLAAPGSHLRTGKMIEPLAPSANPARLGEVRQIEKWLLRNCKWTWGRECTAREKGDFLQFLRTQ